MEEPDKISRSDIHDKLWEARDFEISHLWQRSIFLATFIVMLFTAYFGVLSDALDGKEDRYEQQVEHQSINLAITYTSEYSTANKAEDDWKYIVMLDGICVAGFAFSVMWVCMARGSKYMYERIEAGINNTYADLSAWDDDLRMRMEFEYCEQLWNLGNFNRMPRHGSQPLSDYDYRPFSRKGSTFSPSKININIGYAFIIIWIALFVLPFALFELSFPDWLHPAWFAWGGIILISLAIFMLLPIWIGGRSLTGSGMSLWSYFLAVLRSMLRKPWSGPDDKQLKWIQSQLKKGEIRERVIKGLQDYCDSTDYSYLKRTVKRLEKRNRKSDLRIVLAHENAKSILEIELMQRDNLDKRYLDVWTPVSTNSLVDTIEVESNSISIRFIGHGVQRRLTFPQNSTDVVTKFYGDTDWPVIRRGEEYDLIKNEKVARVISKRADGSMLYIIFDRSVSYAERYQYGPGAKNMMKLTILQRNVIGNYTKEEYLLRKPARGVEKLSLIIPTLNPGRRFKSLVDEIFKQTRIPDEILIVDSSSDDGSLDFLSKYEKVKVKRIDRKDFDHGGTRDWAIRNTDCDYCIFMTQDALLHDQHSIENLVVMLDGNSQLSVVGGRQVAYPDAKRAEKLIREFNYPDKTMVWGKDEAASLGIKAFMISDVFAAYRKSAYLKCGGFDHPITTNEDMLMAQKFIDHGYSLGYCSDAIVYHSHDNSLKQEYERNRLIGYTLEKFKHRFDGVTEYGRGFDLVFFVSKRLLKGLHFISFVSFGFNCVARLMGNMAGRKQARAEDNGKS